MVQRHVSQVAGGTDQYRGRMSADGQRRPPLYADPDLPTSIDIINAFGGDGAAIRRRLVELPKGPSPLPATFAFVLILIGGWLTMSAFSLPRLAIDELDGLGARDASGREVGAPVPFDREVLVARRSRAGSARLEEQRLSQSADQSSAADLGVAVAGPASPAHGASCSWAPDYVMGTRTISDAACLRVPANSSLRVERNSDGPDGRGGGEVVVVEADRFPTQVNLGYLWQGLLPLSAGISFAVMAAVASFRYRRRQRRYVRIMEGRMQVPLPGVG